MFKKPMSLLALKLYRGKRRLLVSLQDGIYTDVYYLKRNLFSALSVCITDGKVRDSLISGAGTVGDGTGSSVLGNIISPYFTVKNMLVRSMYRFVAGTYRFTGWWYRFLQCKHSVIRAKYGFYGGCTGSYGVKYSLIRQSGLVFCTGSESYCVLISDQKTIVLYAEFG